MKIKYAFGTILTILIISSGCNNKNIEDKTAVEKDKEIRQRTINKVQNDVNEIINKDYKYVIENMGQPYCKTYYIDKDTTNLDGIYNLDYTSKMRLVYPKEESNKILGKSAIYIEINNDKVTEVNTYEYEQEDIRKADIKNNANLILDIYDMNSYLSNDTISKISIKDYIGKQTEDINEVINIDKANFEIYDRDRNNMILGYTLSDTKDKFFTIIEIDGKITEILVANIKDIINLSKDYLITN